jgi:Tfp pilus assembly protein PilP
MATAPRPDGIPGLLIDEIQLTGIFRTGKGYVAQVRSGTKSYLLRTGDQLFDGDVVAIAKDEVVFKQSIQDPASPKPFREVVMTLRP